MAAGRFDLAVADELADFRRKGGSVDIEVVGELLAREGDFKRIASSRLGPHFQIGEQLFRRRVLRQAVDLPREERVAVRKGLNWDAWLATAKARPFLDQYPADAKVYDPWKLGKNVYHTFTWRGFFDFGCGAFGDMACHTMNMPFRGLELADVSDAECVRIEEKNDTAYPSKSIVKLTYRARDSKVRPGVKLPAVTLYWYDGDQQKDGDKKLADLMPAVVAMPQYKGKVPRKIGRAHV